jgi:alpha-galactosidase
MAILENNEAGTSLFWQIEHNGSWHWEIIDQSDLLTLLISGPTEHDNHWWISLQPGEEFVSVPAAVGEVQGSVDEAAQQLTRYRRLIRRPNDDNRNLKIIFNDYMNCLWGDPTTEKLLPLIDAAASVGCEYFCIDAGWYAPGEWWDGVGEWLPSAERFPEGIKYVLDYIRSRGMIPGLWLELEVMGINSPKLKDTDDSWFFQRHGKRVKDRSRYQLDYRNPYVIAHADEVIRRLVEDYGVGYIKMDYNINAGIGTDKDADSVGDGLLQHNRAYLAWLDRIFARYPELVIENCSSGGMRMDYAMLSRHSIQSTSDQENYVNYAAIAAASPSALTPEQSAIWSYPLREGDDEEVVFNMVNALLLRVHQSGHLAELSPRRRELVKEALDYYKSIRHHIPQALPFWPLGLPKQQDEWICLGLRHEDAIYLAVWRIHGESTEISLSLPQLQGKRLEICCAYPQSFDCRWSWSEGEGLLKVTLPETKTARLLEIKLK